ARELDPGEAREEVQPAAAPAPILGDAEAQAEGDPAPETPLQDPPVDDAEPLAAAVPAAPMLAVAKLRKLRADNQPLRGNLLPHDLNEIIIDMFLTRFGCIPPGASIVSASISCPVKDFSATPTPVLSVLAPGCW
ncbi:unnamed protein product, partial [Prorocentrum cordatum]